MSVPGPGYQRRYAAFAASQGRTPEAQAAHDDALPTGRNVAFIRWMTDRIGDWRKTHGAGPIDHVAFDAWLEGGAL